MTETSGYNDVHKDAKIDGATNLDQSRESVLFMVEDENCWVEQTHLLQSKMAIPSQSCSCRMLCPGMEHSSWQPAGKI